MISLRTSVREMINSGVLHVRVHGELRKAMRFTKGPKCRLWVLFIRRAMVMICLFCFKN